jgi:hypothetical protein
VLFGIILYIKFEGVKYFIGQQNIMPANYPCLYNVTATVEWGDHATSLVFGRAQKILKKATSSPQQATSNQQASNQVNQQPHLTSQRATNGQTKRPTSEPL